MPALPPQVHEGRQMFDARALHAWLGRKREFAKWIIERIEEYGFEEGPDFSSIVTKTGGRPRKDYLITIDMAKELSMIERTERGRETRRYLTPFPCSRRTTTSAFPPRLTIRPHSWTNNPSPGSHP